ncbi:hypothetical protein BJ982_004548 [Sphaerisporangium siamense]|uniref:Uncharacterized protein n=1 Tax=Sphaerisporangium siamense TaxID=795645 RepID=A0A7W7DA02_9ACTN|nr:hypothetical protein [Sphaerisporangium siamense]
MGAVNGRRGCLREEWTTCLSSDRRTGPAGWPLDREGPRPSADRRTPGSGDIRHGGGCHDRSQERGTDREAAGTGVVEGCGANGEGHEGCFYCGITGWLSPFLAALYRDERRDLDQILAESPLDLLHRPAGPGCAGQSGWSDVGDHPPAHGGGFVVLDGVAVSEGGLPLGCLGAMRDHHGPTGRPGPQRDPTGRLDSTTRQHNPTGGDDRRAAKMEPSRMQAGRTGFSCWHPHPQRTPVAPACERPRSSAEAQTPRTTPPADADGPRRRLG